MILRVSKYGEPVLREQGKTDHLLRCRAASIRKGPIRNHVC